MNKISTSGWYDTNLYEVRRPVIKTHTESVSLFRGLIAGIRSLAGGKSALMNEKLDDVIKHLTKDIIGELSHDEHIIGVQFTFTEFGRTERNTFLSGIATGTIVGPKIQTGGKKRKTRKRV